MPETPTLSKPTPSKKGKQPWWIGEGRNYLQCSALDVANFLHMHLASNVIYVPRRFSGVGTAIFDLQRGQRNGRQALAFQGSYKDAKLGRVFQEKSFLVKKCWPMAP